jgi:glycosyltransferase involved in cell wall biosynthesis
MTEVDHVVTIADSMRDEIIARGIEPAKVTVIPNAVDPASFEPRAADPGLVRSLGLDGKVVLGYISNLGAREGIDVLIEATALLRARGLPVACVIVGEGPERPALEKKIAELGIGDAVTLVGAVPHDTVNDYYALIDIFVIPRKDDRAARWVTPLKPFEAMAMGKALIVSSLPALVEICAPDTRGLAFDVGDASDLAQKAELLINDPERRRELGEHARDWVLRERTWDKNGERYRALYEKIIARHVPRAPSAVTVEQPAPAGDVDALRAEIAAMETQADELRDRALKAERAFRTSRWRRARAAVVRAGKDPRALVSHARRVPGVVRRRRQASPSSTMGGLAPQLAARSSGSAGADPATGDLSLLEYGMQALRFFASRNGDAPATERPIIMAYYPLVRNNPYQQMLYGHCWNHGIAPLPIADLNVLADVPALRELGAEFWLHVHWTGAILAKSQTRADARAAHDAFVARLDSVVNAGGRIVWTVHNVLPHERTFEDLEISISEALAERASVIHVLCGDTPSLTQPHYTLPAEKVRVIPHSSYLGVYPNVVDTSQARFALGLLPHQTVLAFVGGIRPYKGLDALLDAYQPLARENPDLRLIVAGPPIDFPNLRLLRRRCEADPSIIVRMTRIPETDLQLYFNAADAVVLPYTDILNSGALMLALSFGRPVIAANRGCVGSLVSEDVGLLFDPKTPGDLARALRRAPELKDERFARAALRVAESVPPTEIADRFARLIREETTVSGRAAAR